jgi:hypothetical protein
MAITNPFTHAADGEFGGEYQDQIQEHAWHRVTASIDRITASLDPKYHGNRPEVICQLAAAMVNAEMLLLLNQSIQEGVMFLGKTNLYVAKTIETAVKKITEELS